MNGDATYIEQRLNSDLWEAAPLSEDDTARLGRALHQRSRKIDIMRLGEGRRVSVNGATFDFGALMATLREQFSDPDARPMPVGLPMASDWRPDGATHFDVAARRWAQYVKEGKHWIYVRLWKLDGSGWTRHPVEVSTESRSQLVPITQLVDQTVTD